MNLLTSFVIAFSMYSTIPMPRLDWSKDSMKYAMCFFPLVGAVVGAVFLLWAAVCSLVGIGGGLFAAGAVVFPVLLSGGIHVDGFCDVMDALSSNQPTDRKLEILKDSHTGAFAIIGCVLYFVASFGLWTELKLEFRSLVILALGFLLSRTLSGLSVVSFRCAKNSGLVATFSDAAAKQRVRVTLIVFLVVCALVMLGLWFAMGLGVLLAAGGVFLYYKIMSYRQFGGITGDLAGYFLQLCELFMLVAVIAVQKLAQL